VGDIFVQRHERDRSRAFVQRQVFPPKSSVDQAEDAERRAVVRVKTDRRVVGATAPREGPVPLRRVVLGIASVAWLVLLRWPGRANTAAVYAIRGFTGVGQRK